MAYIVIRPPIYLKKGRQQNFPCVIYRICIYAKQPARKEQSKVDEKSNDGG